MLSEENPEKQTPQSSEEKKNSGTIKRRRRPYRDWKKKGLPTKVAKPIEPNEPKMVTPPPITPPERKMVEKKSYHDRRALSNRRPKQRTSRFQDDSVFEGMVEIDFSNLFFHEHGKALALFNADIPAGLRQLKFPGLDTKIARERIVAFIKETLAASGKQAIYVGISGGVDSAVTAALAMAALGNEKVRFVHFIEMEKSAPARARADLISRSLKNHLEMHDLRPRLQTLGGSGGTLTEKKNRIARARMLALHELADANQALVVGSLNKTKRLLGYGTRFGDLAYDINPLEDIYFSQLIELARVLNVPKVILDQSLLVGEEYRPKQKVDDVWKEIDFYFYQMVEIHISLSHLRKIGMDEEKLLWLYQRMRHAIMAGGAVPCLSMLDATIPNINAG